MKVCGWLHAPFDLSPPGKELSVPIGEQAGWVPEPVWTLWNTVKSLDLAGNQTPVVQSVARHYTVRAIPAPKLLPVLSETKGVFTRRRFNRKKYTMPETDRDKKKTDWVSIGNAKSKETERLKGGKDGQE
jgi:hypothetical protein